MPVELRGQFCRRRVMDPSKCAKGSLRTVIRGKNRIIVCCPKGEWNPRARSPTGTMGRCEVGTRAQAILTPSVRGRCPTR